MSSHTCDFCNSTQPLDNRTVQQPSEKMEKAETSTSVVPIAPTAEIGVADVTNSELASTAKEAPVQPEKQLDGLDVSEEKKEYVEEKVMASVDVISEVFKHPNADSLWIARVQGWDVIINLKAMFGDAATPENVVGRKVVYVQIDSVMPTVFENNLFWKYLSSTYMGKKVRSTKLRGVFSQGLILDFETIAPLFPELGAKLDSLPAETNVTNELGIVKYYSIYDAEGPAYFGAYDKSQIKGRPSPASLRPFPEFLQKTDQPRLQAQRKLVLGLEPDRLFTATQKFDGQSVQWFHKDGRVGVCSRNFEVLLELDLPEDKRDKANDKFREMNTKYSIFDKLLACKRNVSVQTEMYGMGINGNRHKKNDVNVAVFDVFDIDRRQFITHDEMVSLAAELGLPTVPVVFENQRLLSEKIEPWLELANKQRYAGGLLAEGIVVRTADGKAPYMSFKVISQEYLVKYDL